jgi:hypothetical protein
MSPLLTGRQNSAGFRLFVHILCVAIFAWGLQAKLSQYKTSKASHPVTVVKLLQPEQSNKKTSAIAPGERSGSVQLVIYRTVILFKPQIIACRDRQVRKSVSSAIPSYPHDLLFRPPPLNA